MSSLRWNGTGADWCDRRLPSATPYQSLHRTPAHTLSCRRILPLTAHAADHSAHAALHSAHAAHHPLSASCSAHAAITARLARLTPPHLPPPPPPGAATRTSSRAALRARDLRRLCDSAALSARADPTRACSVAIIWHLTLCFGQRLRGLPGDLACRRSVDPTHPSALSLSFPFPFLFPAPFDYTVLPT